MTADSVMMMTDRVSKKVPVIITLSFALFLHGFFPMKNNLPGYATKNTSHFLDGEISQPNKMFDKVVIILIDALRADFVFERKLMPFLSAKLETGNSRHFTLRAHPPTVTLPRIKAITTGSIPGFIDMVMNFQSGELSGDNIVTQAYRDHRRIAFYGDDTWIKLFPNHFTDSDGTTSFFVTDYTEVDDNVTRHIDERLSALDWDLMILHYLGLDHIGHTVGPNSPLVQTKLAEMDGIIEDIYNTMDEKGEDFVLLICGDHGMSDQGSHGGASDREVFVPAMFVSPKYKHTENRWRSSRELLQIDLAPTLSMLMGIPIPINNLGQALLGVFDGYTDMEKLNLIFINFLQVYNLMEKNVPDFSAGTSFDLYTHTINLYKKYVTEDDSLKPDVSMAIRACETAIDAMATRISKSLTTYDIYAMIVAVMILFLCLLSASLSAITVKEHGTDSGSLQVFLLVGVAIFGHVTVCTSQSYSCSSLCGRSLYSFGAVSLVWLTIVYLTVTILKSFQWWKRKQKMLSCFEGLLLFGTVTHSLSFLSSSFVEEEHQTWYFLSMTLYLLVTLSLITNTVTKHCKICENSSGADKFITKTITKHYKICQNSSVEDNLHVGQADDLYDKWTDNNCDSNNYNEDIPYSSHKIRGRFVEESTTERSSQISSSPSKQITPSNGGHSTKGGEMLSQRLGMKWKMLPWQPIVAMVTVMCIGRCMRSINQTGNKWLDTPDLGDWLVRPENADILSYMTVVSLVVIGFTKVRELSVRTILFVFGLTGCYCYRISTGTIHNVLKVPGYDERSKGISEAYFVYGSILLINLTTIVKFMWRISHNLTVNLSITERMKFIHETIETVQSTWVIFITLLLRPHNVIFVAMMIVQEQLLWRFCITKLSTPVWCHTLLCWWIGQAAFFHQGNSNSMSTVDVSAGYVGLEEFNSVLVTCLLYSSTYAGPIYWLITLLKSLVYHAAAKETDQKMDDDESNKAVLIRFQDSLSECIQTLSLERAFTLCVYCTVVTVERYHLFVWTVFSPKLLFEGMVTLTYVMFCMLLGLIQSII